MMVIGLKKNKVDEKLDTVPCDCNNDSIESCSDFFGYISNLKVIDNVSEQLLYNG